MQKLIHNDEYQGPRHRYGFRYRPVGMFHQPAGYIIGSQRPHPQYRPHGTLDWPVRLTDDEMRDYQLQYVGPFE